jgi:hypothetical protein
MATYIDAEGIREALVDFGDDMDRLGYPGVLESVEGAGVVGRIDAAEPLVMLGGQRQHAPAQRPQPLDQDVADARIPAGVDRRLGKRS